MRLAEQRYDWIKRGVSGEHVLQPGDGLSAGNIHLTPSTTLHQHGPCAWEQVLRWRHGPKAVLAQQVEKHHRYWRLLQEAGQFRPRYPVLCAMHQQTLR